METSPSSKSPLIDFDGLTKVVRSALASEIAEIKNWQLTQIGGGMGNPVSVGLFRLHGVANNHGRDDRWSVILKVLQSPDNLGIKDMGESDDPLHWNYWKRETLVYQSGLLDSMPEGLAAPRCYAVEELPGNIARLWLEDIRDMYQGAWTLERYSLTARHLGKLNGMYIDNCSFTEYPWLGRELNRQWLQSFAWQEFQWGHPVALSRYPEPDENPFKQLLLQHERFLGKLDLLPKTISHGDTYPTNFMSRIDREGREQTVAIDWALIGVQPLGYDLGQFVFGAISNLKDANQIEVIDTLFEAYFQGLREEGCELDAKSVRFGFVVSAALRVGLFQVLMLTTAIEQIKADIYMEPSDNVPDAFEVVMAREAFQLIE